MKKEVVCTQLRCPTDIYSAVKYVAAAHSSSINSAILFLLKEALKFHHHQLPAELVKQLEEIQVLE